MNDKLKDLAKKDNMEIPESFNIKFEESLNNLPQKKKSKYSKYQIAASIMLTVLVGSGVAIAISNNKYKYIPTTGSVFENEGAIYGLDDVIVQDDKQGNDIVLDMQIIEDTKKAVVNIGGKYFLPKSDKAELKIGDKVYKNYRSNIGELEYSWGAIDVFSNIKGYEEGENIVYTLYLDDENKIDFKLELKEIDGVNNYEDLGITSIYNDIPITAIVNENEENLVVDFVSSKDKVHINPGIDGVDGTYSAIYLVDANGTSRVGLREIKNGSIKYDRVKFDTRNTQKPYKIVIPQVSADYTAQGENTYSEELSLNIPKNGESIEINKEIKLDIGNTGIQTNNNTVKLTSGKREGNKFIVRVEYPENETDKDYLRQVFAIEDKLVGEDKLSFAMSDFDENMKLVHTLEFDVSVLKNKVKFRLAPTIYDIKGNWEFMIK